MTKASRSTQFVEHRHRGREVCLAEGAALDRDFVAAPLRHLPVLVHVSRGPGRFGIEVREVRKRAEALHRAEAIFLTNALGLTAVREYSGKLMDSIAVPTKIDDAIKQLLSCKSAA